MILPAARTTVPARVAMIGVPFYALIVGVLVIGSDERRFNGPTFQILKDMPGGMDTFGWWAILAGVMFVVGDQRRIWLLRAAGLGLLSMWSAAFGVCAVIAIIFADTTPPTGGPTYLFIAFLLGNLIGYREPAHDEGP